MGRGWGNNSWGEIVRTFGEGRHAKPSPLLHPLPLTSRACKTPMRKSVWKGEPKRCKFHENNTRASEAGREQKNWEIVENFGRRRSRSTDRASRELVRFENMRLSTSDRTSLFEWAITPRISSKSPPPEHWPRGNPPNNLYNFINPRIMEGGSSLR